MSPTTTELLIFLFKLIAFFGAAAWFVNTSARYIYNCKLQSNIKFIGILSEAMGKTLEDIFKKTKNN